MPRPSTILMVALLLTLVAPKNYPETGSACADDDECPALHSCEKNICVHKNLFPITAREVFSTFLILIMNALLTAGGVGAGAAYVPYIQLLFETSLAKSISIGYACVFGGGVGNLCSIIFIKNPKTGRYIINYDFNLIILPALMVGVLIGIILQRIFAPIVTSIILLFVLGYSFTKNIYKLKANLAKERAERLKRQQQVLQAVQAVEDQRQIQDPPLEVPQQESQPQNVDAVAVHIDEVQPQIQNIAPETVPQDNQQQNTEVGTVQGSTQTGTPESDQKETAPKIIQDGRQPTTFNSFAVYTAATSKEPSNIQNIVLTTTVEDNLEEQRRKEEEIERKKATKRMLIEKKQQKFPFYKMKELVIIIVIIVVIGLIRGNKVFRPIVGRNWTCGWDFTFFGVEIALFALCLIRNVHLVFKWQREKKEVDYEFLPEEPVLNLKRIAQLVVRSVFAGIIGAIVALGGAMIIGPAQLDMGMPPAFSAATTGVFMIFSMFNTMFNTILNKKLTGLEIAWFLPLAFAFSFISSKIVNWYVKKTGRQSTVIILVMSITAVGFLGVVATFVKNSIEHWPQESLFGSVC